MIVHVCVWVGGGDGREGGGGGGAVCAVSVWVGELHVWCP